MGTRQDKSTKIQTMLLHSKYTPIEARVALRFMRMGRKRLPFYRLVAIDSRKKRESRPIEFLGWYNPLTKETNLNSDSTQNWLDCGAKPSTTVMGLLKRAMIIKNAL